MNLGRNDTAEAVAPQTDGKIVLGGGADDNFAAARLLPDGALDVTFDTDGMATIFLTGSDDRAYDVAIQPDGKIVVAGEMFIPGNRDAIVARAMASGALDSTVGSDGVASVGFGNDFEQFDDVTIQPNGNIVVAGNSRCQRP